MSIIVTSASECCWIPPSNMNDYDNDDDVVIQHQLQSTQHQQQKSINDRKRRVTFCSCSDGDEEVEKQPVMTEVIEVTHSYPSDYFYSRSDLARFRREVSEERRRQSSPSISSSVSNTPCSSSSSSLSPVERALNIATSSLLIATLFVIALLATTIASIPILLLLKMASLLFPDLFGREDQEEDVDSSIRPYSPPPPPSSTTSSTSKLATTTAPFSTENCEAVLSSFMERMLYHRSFITSNHQDSTSCLKMMLELEAEQDLS